MNKWIMLLCAGLLVVMIGCGPKDPAAEGGAGDEVTKPEGDVKVDEKKPEEAPVTTPDEKKPEDAGTPAADEKKPEEPKGGPGTPEKTETTPEAK